MNLGYTKQFIGVHICTILHTFQCMAYAQPVHTYRTLKNCFKDTDVFKVLVSEENELLVKRIRKAFFTELNGSGDSWFGFQC